MGSLTKALKGGQIFDNAMCGDDSGNVPISEAAMAQVKAGVFLGDPHHTPDTPFAIGDCQANGVSLAHLLAPTYM